MICVFYRENRLYSSVLLKCCCLELTNTLLIIIYFKLLFTARLHLSARFSNGVQYDLRFLLCLGKQTKKVSQNPTHWSTFKVSKSAMIFLWDRIFFFFLLCHPSGSVFLICDQNNVVKIPKFQLMWEGAQLEQQMLADQRGIPCLLNYLSSQVFFFFFPLPLRGASEQQWRAWLCTRVNPQQTASDSFYQECSSDYIVFLAAKCLLSQSVPKCALCGTGIVVLENGSMNTHAHFCKTAFIGHRDTELCCAHSLCAQCFPF